MRHEEWVMHSGFSPDGRLVVTVGADDTARVWIAPIRDGRESDDWIRLAQMLSGTRIDRSGELVAITPEEFRDAWRVLRSKYPHDFVASPEEVQAWHRSKSDD
jgi:hypothetical protein